MVDITITQVVEWTISVFQAVQSMTSTKTEGRTRDTCMVYGADYQISTFNPFKKNLDNHHAPCVVCFVKSRASMLMMPARNDCPSGWTEEYHGYLMTAYRSQKKQHNFICVDEDAESYSGSKAKKHGALLYPVEGVCNSLPCRPYVDGRELTCAVCTK